MHTKKSKKVLSIIPILLISRLITILNATDSTEQPTNTSGTNPDSTPNSSPSATTINCKISINYFSLPNNNQIYLTEPTCVDNHPHILAFHYDPPANSGLVDFTKELKLNSTERSTNFTLKSDTAENLLQVSLIKADNDAQELRNFFNAVTEDGTPLETDAVKDKINNLKNLKTYDLEGDMEASLLLKLNWNPDKPNLMEILEMKDGLVPLEKNFKMKTKSETTEFYVDFLFDPRNTEKGVFPLETDGNTTNKKGAIQMAFSKFEVLKADKTPIVVKKMNLKNNDGKTRKEIFEKLGGKKAIWKEWWFWLILVFAVVILLGIVFACVGIMVGSKSSS